MQYIMLPVGPNPRRRPAAIFENFEWLHLCNGSSYPLHIWFVGRVFGVSESNEPTSDWTKSKVAAVSSLV